MNKKIKILIIGVLILAAGFVFIKFILAENDSNTVSLLHMNGTDASTAFPDCAVGGSHTWTVNGDAQIDTTTTGKTITANGNAQIDTALSKFGGASALFDGTGDYLSIPNNSDWNFGSGDFTIDTWVKRADSGNPQGIWTWRTDSGDSTNNFNAEFNNNATVNAVRMYINNSDGTSYSFSANTAITDTNWHHIAVVKNGTTVTIYLDGVADGSTTVSGSFNMSSKAFNIASYYTVTPSNYFNGSVDEFRVSKGIARWTANFTPPTAAYSPDQYTSLLAHADGTDGSTSFSDDSTGKFSQSAAFDGTGDYLTAADSADWDFGTGDFTVDGWVRIPDTTGGTVIGHNEGASGEWEVYVNGTTNYIAAEGSYTDGTAINVRDTSNTISTTTWAHFGFIRLGNNLLMLVDGKPRGTQDATGKTLNMTPTGGIGIGARNGGTSVYKGWIDELRVSKGIARFTGSGYTDSNASFNTTELRYSQGFKVGSTTSISAFTVKLARNTGSETGTLTGYIYSDDGTGKPNASLATFSNMDVSIISNSPTYTEYSFGGSYTPVVGTQYHLVLIWTNANSGAIRINTDDANSYADGAPARWNGSSWDAQTNDVYFGLNQVSTYEYALEICGRGDSRIPDDMIVFE
jgi:hypothetical protein